MPVQDDYQIDVEAFCGPLDLLLFLIRRAEVDIHDIPIATITDQYLTLLHGLDDVDIDQAGDFLVMAATLIEIKSRSLTPAVASAAAEEGERAEATDGGLDPRQDLIRQLLAYQRYRVASERLEERRQEFLQRFRRRPPRSQPIEETEPEELELEDVHLLDLSEAYERIMGSIDFARLGDHRVEMDDTPLALHQEDLLDRLTRTHDHRLTLQQAFEGHTRTQRIGLFLATLELVRQRRVSVRQPEIDSAIELVLVDEEQEGSAISPDPFGEEGSAISHQPSGQAEGSGIDAPPSANR